jgi:[acyl-carrier-protein] S-malonyltransferase
MASAARQFAALVADLPLQTPRVPVVANVSGEAMGTVDEVRHELTYQVERPVNWTKSVRTMVALGPSAFLEVGAGQVLSGLIKRIDREAPILTLGDLDLDLPKAS